MKKLWYNSIMAKEEPRKLVVESHDKPAEAGGSVVDAEKDMTVRRALTVLKGGAEIKKLRSADKKPKLKIAGQEIPDPKRSYENLQSALAKVKECFGHYFHINLDEMYFRKFHGNMVGESRKEGTYYDPILLMHPVQRFAHVKGHELGHDKGRIKNEPLVDVFAQVKLFFGAENPLHGFELAEKKFIELAKRCDKNGNFKAGTEKLYAFYYRGESEKMYELYEKNYMAGLATEAEKDQAFGFFREVFPELHYVAKEQAPGHFNLKTLNNVPAKKRKGEKEEVDVVDLDAYRKKVAGVEEEVRRTGKEG